MNSEETRRRLLDERARNPADFIGLSSRPEQLADSVGFQSVRGHVGLVDAEAFLYANRDSAKPRPLIGAPTSPVHDFTRHTFQQVSSNCDGSNPNDTQWIGYITGTADTANGSPTLSNCNPLPGVGDKVAGGSVPGGTTITAVNAGLNQATMSANAGSNATGVTLTYTGNNHPWPAAANGSWALGLNMWPFFTPDGLVTPGTIGATASVTGQIDILDQSSTVLLTMSRNYTFTQTGPGVLSCALTLNTNSEPTTPLAQFYGLKFSISGGNFNIGSNWSLVNQLVILDPSDLVADKAFP